MNKLGAQKYEEKVSDLFKRFEEKRLRNVKFLVVSIAHQEFARIVQRNKHKIEGEANLNLVIGIYNESISELKKQNTNHNEILLEKVFVDQFSLFEEFIYDVFYCLFSSFPKFIGKDSDNKVAVEIEDLFISENLELCQKQVIERKVKSLIQSNNIKKIFGKFKSIFSLDFGIEEFQIKELVHFSLLRNLLIHNGGRVNSIYLDEVKKHSITKNELPPGTSINEKILKPLAESFEELIEVISKKLFEKLINESSRLNNYHKKI